MRDWKVWAKGLLSAVIGGCATAGVLYIVDPVTFSDWGKLGSVMLATGALHAFMYLKKSPLP